jgi:hypothetical protein
MKDKTMAHFAKVENGKVTQVIVAEQEFIDTGALGDPSQWVQTSYNTRNGVHYNPETGEPSEDQSKALRWNYAGTGMVYDAEDDVFYDPQPWNSWTLDRTTYKWVPPIPRPIPENEYRWIEEDQEWIKIV